MNELSEQTEPMYNSNQYSAVVNSFWKKKFDEARTGKLLERKGGTGAHPMPLARVKKAMIFISEDISNIPISGDAPLICSKACELFVQEMTFRAWLSAQESKRRTLQRNDISTSLLRSDQYDFLYDFIPKEDLPPFLCQLAGKSKLAPKFSAMENQSLRQTVQKSMPLLKRVDAHATYPPSPNFHKRVHIREHSLPMGDLLPSPPNEELRDNYEPFKPYRTPPFFANPQACPSTPSTGNATPVFEHLQEQNHVRMPVPMPYHPMMIPMPMKHLVNGPSLWASNDLPGIPGNHMDGGYPAHYPFQHHTQIHPPPIPPPSVDVYDPQQFKQDFHQDR